MAAKFTHGDSVATTRKVTAKNPPPNVSGHNKTLDRGNTMSGMPGYIDAHPSEKIDSFKGGAGCGPKREMSVGERGSSGAKGMGKSKAEGTTVKNYHHASTRKAGGMKSNNHDGSKHVHTGNVAKHSGGSHSAPPTAHGHIPGGGHAAGIDRGKMEHLRGHASTSYERPRRKSMMY